MSNSKSSAKTPRLSQSDIKFFQLAAFVMLTAAAGLAALWAPTVSYAHWQSDRLVEDGRRAHGAEAQTDFLLAMHLNRGNVSAHLELARIQIASDHSDDAIATLDRLGEGSEPQRLKIRTLIELARYAEAAGTATTLLQQSTPTDTDIHLAGLAYLLAARPSDATALTARASSDTATAIARAQASHLVLAQQLYALGLPKTAIQLLESRPASYDRNVLLARLYYARHSKTDLTHASNLLLAAVELSPASLNARRLLVTVSTDLRDTAQAAHQSALITRLEATRP